MSSGPLTETSGIDRSMSLLVDMTTAAMDPAYGEAAARRAAPSPRPAGSGPRGPRRVPLLLVALLVVVGALTGIATSQVRRRAADAGSGRRALVAEVHRQTTQTDQLEVQASRLRGQVQRARDVALGAGATGRSAAGQVAELELVTGGTSVRGPGLVVTLDDARDVSSQATNRAGQFGSGRVYDRDVQAVVNALWAAGAEAISVNGQRLTAMTAIRSAGEAILVDFRPLSPPYVLRAVGSTEQMEPRFADSATARRFTTWISLYGIGFAVNRALDLRLPAASTPDLRLARAAPALSASPSAAPATTGSPTRSAVPPATPGRTP